MTDEKLSDADLKVYADDDDTCEDRETIRSIAVELQAARAELAELRERVNENDVTVFQFAKVCADRDLLFKELAGVRAAFERDDSSSLAGLLGSLLARPEIAFIATNSRVAALNRAIAAAQRATGGGK